MKTLKKKHHLFHSYELEIKISLILLIGFLLSLNFISIYSLGKARLAQQAGFSTKIKLASKLIQENIRLNYMKLPDASYLNDIISITGINAIEIYDNSGSQLIAVSSEHQEKVENPVFKISSVVNSNGQTVYDILVSGFNLEGAELKRLVLFDTIFRVSGLFVGLMVAYFFIRSVLNPYQKIRKEASKLNLSGIVIDDDDSVEYAVKMFQEVIRELKQKESLLQAMYNNSEKRADSLARYNEYILGSISSGVIICDNQGVITRFNKSAENIVGFSERYSQGRHYNEVFGKKHQISKIFGDALRKNITYSRTEFEISRKDSENLWIGLSSSLISDNNNNKIGAAVLLTDLTKIKKLQEVSDFTEKMAALGEMSAGLAHELRNSVAAILGFGKLLKKIVNPEEKTASIAQMIISESIATEEMLCRFLNFASPLNVVPMEVNIEKLLNESLNTAKEMHQDKNIKIEMDIRSKNRVINGDPILLKNAFSNLMINAYQAMDETGTLRTCSDYDRKKDEILITISDTGKGIPENDQTKIFNPFFTTRDKGTGLGLALVRKIITGHMGNIEVDSKEGIGATFIIHLPVKMNYKKGDDNIPNKNAETSFVPEVTS